MKKFNLVKSLTRVINNRKGLLILCLSLAVFGVESVWGASAATWTVKVGVKDGKGGTAKAEIWEDASSDKKTTETSETSSSLVSTSCSDKTSIVHWSLNSYYGKFIATASAGYSFLDWYDANGNAQNKSATFSTNSSNNNSEWTYYAKFTPNTNTAYIVKHYKENVAGTGYDLADTDNLTGTTDTKVTPNRKSYTGFTAPAGQEITIKGDGSASVSYNYTRNSYTLTWNLDGGTITTAGTSAGFVKYGATLTAPAVSKAGAQFNGWSPEVSATMPADNVTYTAQWVSKYDFEMSGENRSMKVDEELPNAFTFTHADNPVAHISNTNVVTYDATNNKLIAHQEGTATIYFTQAATTTIQAGTSDTYTITVSKITNTLTADASHSMKVDETWSGVISGKNSDATVTTTTSDGTIAYYDVANNKIIAQNTGNQSFNSKEVTITISQEATYKYTAAEKTITVTVNKWDNHISINGSQDNYQASIYVDAQQSINLTATNTDYSGSPITATQTAGEGIVALNDAHNQVSSNSKLGTATWSLSQPENYKFKAANATFTISVIKQAEATDCYVLNDANEHSNKTTVTSTKGVYGDPLVVNGPADKLTFDIKYEGSILPSLKLFVEYSIDGGNSYNNVYPDAIEERPSDYKSFGPYTLDDRTTHIRFYSAVGTTNTVKYKNVRVTRKTYLNASDLTIEKTTANEVIYPNEKGEGTITINRSLASGGNLKVAWDSDKFTINGKSAAEGLDLGDFGCATGTSTLNVVFSSDVAGTFSTPVRIYNKVYNTTVTFTGITHERETSPFADKEATLDISVNEQDKVTLDLATLTNDYIGNGEITYSVISGEGANLSDATFYATKVGTYQVKATAAQTNKYNKAEKTITINVVKRTPSITWKTFEHIYAGDILEDVASTSYNDNPVELGLTYEKVSGEFVVEGNKLHINQFNDAHTAKVKVTTTETDYYAATSEEHEYYLESKAIPKFYLNGEEMSTETENNLTLKVGETANVSFDQIEETDFNYTQNAQFVTYAHNSENHTGVITATAFGDEGFQFHQTGTGTVFDRICQMHIWVKKHADTLDSPIHDNDVWLVDSVYTGAMYTIKDDGYTGQAKENVVVESSNEAVIRHQQDGSWKAVGDGTATITIKQINNAYWTGDTITRVIKVEKHTPVITWNIENAQYPWGSVITTPVTSSNTDIPFTVTSNNKAVADYVDGRIVVYNTTNSVTFTLTQEGNDKWNAATTNLTKSFSTFQPANHVPFTLDNNNNTNFYSTHSGTYTWSNGYKLGTGTINTFNKNTSSVTIRFTGVPDKLSFTKTLSKTAGFLPGDGDCNCYVYESADGSSWSQCWKDVERVETKNVSNIQLQPTTRYLKFEYNNSCVYCTYSNINVTERSSIEPVANSLDFGTGYNGNTAAKRTVDVNWYSVMPCTVAISGTDASQFSLGDDSKTIPSMLDNSGVITLSVFYAHEENKSHSATLTITSGDTPAKTATIQLAGTTERAPQEIIWREDITPLPHNGGVYEGAALASSGGVVVLTSDDENIVKVVDGGLQPVGVGTTTVHAYQAGDDIKWQPVNAEKEIEVTSLSVQHLIWNDQLNNIKRSEGNDVNITLTAQSDAIEQDPTLVVTYELDDNAKTFASVSGNQLTITGWGSGYITAKQVGNDNYIATQKVKPIISRNPDADCKMLAGEYWEEYTLHTIASKEIAITNGEPATIEFDAKMDALAIGEGLHLDEWYDNSWHEAGYIDWAVMAGKLGSYAHYGPYNLNRKSTKVKFYTNTGATMTRTFKNVEITLVRYLELAQNDMSFAGVDKGAFLDQTFYINYSNLRGTLDVELKNESSNLQILTETVGEECGEIGKMVPVTIRCNGIVCGTENNVIVLSNKEQKLEVPVSATVVPPSQNITWNPQTDILTTDNVELNATCTSNLPISYSSNNTAVATVQQDGSGVWSMTIIKDGTVTITASQAGSADWSPAPDKNVTFTISKDTPTVTTWATPSEVTKWSALSTSTLTGGEASVPGTFSWQDGTEQVERGNSGYMMVFTPTNTNWYNTVTNTVVVPVSKDPQTITWNYTPQPIYCNAQLTFDATASSGLTVRYETSDQNIAYVNGTKLMIISGGNVTITAVQDGDDTWAYASLSKEIEILRWTPTIETLPTANSMLIGKHLDDATLTGGVAVVDDKPVDGSFAWKDGSSTTIDVAGTATRTVIFTPSNPNHYNSTTCEVSVEVKKYAPEITQNPTATAITYGQALNASTLSGLVAMDKVKYPQVEVTGSYGWKEPATQPEAGNQTALVHFTPTNLNWYEEIDIEIPVVVNKAHATTATAELNMIYGQSLDEVEPINTTGDAVSGIIEGTITWGDTVKLTDTPAQGEYDYAVRLAVTDPNYVAETIDGTCHVVVEDGFVFDGHGGDSDWNTEGNWKDDSKPTGAEDKVIVIADAIIIDSEVNVGAITIKQGVDVTIEDGGVLNVGDYDCVSRKEYGNMIIKNGGQLNLSTGEVKVNDFTLEASLGGIKDAERVSARSGSVTNAEQLIVNGNAYFDIALDASGACTQGWYDFTVPFPVNALTGVQRFENGELRTNLKNEVNYAIMSYHEDVRAQGKYGWAKYRGIMQPGQCYTITIDNYYNVYRFVKTTEGSLNASNSLQITATDGGEGGEENKGWNCVGNGTCHHANIAIEGISKVQIYDHATNSYSPIDILGNSFAVGSAFFLQAPQSGSIMYSVPTTTEEILYAPQRNRSTEEYLVTLSSIDGQNVYDQLYLSASDNALDTYEIGRDLSKFGVSSTIAQMWCSAYGMQLCDVELPLEEETTRFPIEMFAPKDDEYTLSVKQTQYDERLFLFYNENLITELTAYDFPIYLNKGINTGYELRMVAGRQITTDVENSEGQSIAPVQKVIINERLYILCGDKTFDATGKLIK